MFASAATKLASAYEGGNKPQAQSLVSERNRVDGLAALA